MGDSAPSSTTAVPSRSWSLTQRPAAGTSIFPAGTPGPVDPSVGVGVAPPLARTSSGVKEGRPVEPPMSVAPNTQASTSPALGLRLIAPNGL